MTESKNNQNSKTNQSQTSGADGGDSVDKSLVDELGVAEDAKVPVYGGRGKFFSAAGRDSPVAEFTDDFLVLHPPQLPYEDENAQSEVIVIEMDDTGVLVNELGQRKKIPGARFKGREIYYYWEQKPGTMKHYAVYFDDDNKHHFLVIEGERLTTSSIYQLRNMTHDGELGKFTEITIE